VRYFEDRLGTQLTLAILIMRGRSAAQTNRV
jgi:hypothetical protein